MPQTDEDFLDSITSTMMSFTNELFRYAQSLGDFSQDAADKLEKGFDSYADSIRSTMRDTSWVPNSIKPPPPRPPPPSAIHIGFIQRCTHWVDQHRAITAAIVGFAGTSAFLVYRYRKLSRRKRRARRALSGAKTEVVILAGSPYSQTTKSIALDLEKRGFLIYIPVGSLEEESAVAELRLTNIHSLNFDITSFESTSRMIEKLTNIIHHPQRHGTDRLHLASLVLVESYPSTLTSGPLQRISASSWSDALNSRVLYPISLIQLFIPLLVSESTTNSVDVPTTLVVVTPSNSSSINVPTRGLESVTTTALTSYIHTLRGELPKSVVLTHVRLGSLAAQSSPSNRLDLTLARIKKYMPSSTTTTKALSPTRKSIKADGESLYPSSSETHKLHHSIFDAVVGRTHGTVFLGRGALLYALVGFLAPSSLVSWMAGYRPQDYGTEPVLGSTKASSASSSHDWDNVSQESVA